VTSTIPVGTAPFGISVEPATDTIYVANTLSGTVSVIGGGSDAVTSTIPVGNHPIGVDAVLTGQFPSTDTVYVANDFDGTVSVISGVTGG
jgi:YVTN family beta-propeller protein